MGVSIVADDTRAVFVDNTEEIAFGPAVRVAGMQESSHREIAEEAQKRCEMDIRKLWRENPNEVKRAISDAKNDLYPEKI